MTKTLTEQWKNGTLKDTWYYILFTNEKLIGIDGCTDSVFWHTDNKILKILAPVPTYEEWEELQESNDGLSKLMFKSLMNRFVKADEERERLEKENAELVQKIHILNEANMSLENTVGKFGKQLDIAVKALRDYADEENWSTATTEINTDYFKFEYSMYGLEHNGFIDAQKALKEIDEVSK